jgi:hypothetical protein
MKQPLEDFRRHTLNYSQETQGSQEPTEKGKQVGEFLSLAIRDCMLTKICRKTKHGVSAIILVYASMVKKTSLNPFRRLLAGRGSTFVSAKDALLAAIEPSVSHQKL